MFSFTHRIGSFSEAQIFLVEIAHRDGILRVALPEVQILRKKAKNMQESLHYHVRYCQEHIFLCLIEHDATYLMKFPILSCLSGPNLKQKYIDLFHL